MQATPPLGMYKRVSASVLKERKVLKILEPKGWKNVKGGVNPPESLKGVYEGRLIGMGESRLETTYTRTINKRSFSPNVQIKVHHSDVLGCSFRMPTVIGALRTIHKYGSFDNYLLNLPPGLLSRDTTRIRDNIRAVLHARLDSLPVGRKLLPLGITSGVGRFDNVRPAPQILGDKLVASGKARVDAWGAGAPVIEGNNKRYEKLYTRSGSPRFGKGTAWRRQVLAVRVKGGGYAHPSESWARLGPDGKVAPGGLMREQPPRSSSSTEEGGNSSSTSPSI